LDIDWENLMQRRTFIRTLAAAGMAAPSVRAESQRPVVLLVPFAVGGISDALARQVAPHLSRALGTTVVVDNVPGASGTLAAQRLLSATPDGSTIMLASSSETILPPLFMASAKYRAEDFRLLAGGMDAPIALLGRLGLKTASLTELLAIADHDGRPDLSCGSLGNGTITHLAAEHFRLLTGMEMLHVPYRGGAPMINDLLAEQIDLAFLPLVGPVLQLAQAGKLRVYGIADSVGRSPLEKYPLLTEHPTLKSFRHSAWTAFAVPRSVADPVAERLNTILNGVLQLPEVRGFAREMGSPSPQAMSLNQAADFYEREIRLTRSLARMVNPQT
jgi:tripartite-type tricarboxylate transporter receptor subunit TctC